MLNGQRQHILHVLMSFSFNCIHKKYVAINQCCNVFRSDVSPKHNRKYESYPDFTFRHSLKERCHSSREDLSTVIDCVPLFSHCSILKHVRTLQGSHTHFSDHEKCSAWTEILLCASNPPGPDDVTSKQ